MGPAQRGKRGRLWWLGLITGLVAAGLFMLSLVVVTSSCVESGGCADRSERLQLVGRLFTGDGRPLAGTFDLALRSVVTHPVTATTDRLGRFCLFVPGEQEFVYVLPRRVVSRLPVDPRFTGPGGARRLAAARAGDYGDSGRAIPRWFPVLLSPPTGGGVMTVNGNVSSDAWRPAQDQPASCPKLDGPAPWYRYKGLADTWQAHTLLLAPPLTWLVVLAGLLVAPARRVLLTVGVAGLAASAALTLVLLDIPRADRYSPNPAWLYDNPDR